MALSASKSSSSSLQVIDKGSYPVSDAWSLGLSDHFHETMLLNMAKSVVRDLNGYGICAIDNFLKRTCDPSLPDVICDEVQGLHRAGKLQAGQVISKQGDVHKVVEIRGDLVTWLAGNEKETQGVCSLILMVDSLVTAAVRLASGGRMSNHNINRRTKAMAACYPGGHSHYMLHVDNAHGDGRLITAIYYLNRDWQESDGGQLVVYSKRHAGGTATIKPLCDRLVLFWSDHTNPHEVRPAIATRYAVTLWYLDEDQRREYLTMMKQMALKKQQQKHQAQLAASESNVAVTGSPQHHPASDAHLGVAVTSEGNTAVPLSQPNTLLAGNPFSAYASSYSEGSSLSFTPSGMQAGLPRKSAASSTCDVAGLASSTGDTIYFSEDAPALDNENLWDLLLDSSDRSLLTSLDSVPAMETQRADESAGTTYDWSTGQIFSQNYHK